MKSKRNVIRSKINRSKLTISFSATTTNTLIKIRTNLYSNILNKKTRMFFYRYDFINNICK